MARKDVFANINSMQPAAERRSSPGYATRGASRSMVNSLSELAEKAALADQAVAGEKVVEIDPALIDPSFITERMEEDEAAFAELVEAIRERGQDTPVLLRPHPDEEGRFQTVFGHRRVRVAKHLQRPVKAVVKDVSDVDHIIAQGQENSARENLSFIERACFAQNLIALGHERRVVQLALSVDAPMLTRMLSVAGRIPADVIAAIGPAKSVGRDRWLDLVQEIEPPKALALAREIILADGFQDAPSEARFDRLAGELKKARRPAKKTSPVGEWVSQDAALKAEYKTSGRSFSLALKSRDAARFGAYLADNLERLHEEFKRARQDEEG
ncbi:plasmid partitioning protein RepB [Allorhizobium sp. BGMRC 0089]|uniref:plasmid partitioning protein RepB n=1 Tax=Allorhizobium sonneratiae TaxID=2934936 RepID=UPI0020335CA1|nr:plasmid partitioning protein RepB [Allorhizobium sonneratiae]MCM2292671.1 plasmid partitioning protein RepB [Allorhizobium sonneratiae]